jgi:hypothetical protein
MKMPNLLFMLPAFLLIGLTQFNKNEIWSLEIVKKPTSITIPNMNNDSISPTLQFSNYTWNIKSGTATPGPNSWSANNAYVDSIGRLHLKISYNTTTKSWDCAEIWTTELFGFGTYEWFVDGPIDKLDKNIVLGLFNYPASPKVPDATNEIDIEYAKWGVETNKPGNFTVWPSQLINGFSNLSYPFNISLADKRTTQRFTWHPNSIVFESLYGWSKDNNAMISRKAFQPEKPILYIPQSAEPVHMNLWLFRGLPPSNNEPVEIIISSFHKSEWL